MDGPDPRIVRFGRLFSGRLDAVGGDTGRAIYTPYTYKRVRAHLEGLDPIGTYPTWPDASGMRWTRWGCCDIDTGDWSEAFQLATALTGMGLAPWVERSRSKGWHVWVFVADPIEAVKMRRCLKVAYAAIDLPAKEANPKSETLAPGQLGNYVRLPYKGGLIMGEGIQRQCMMACWGPKSDGTPMSFASFATVNTKFLFSDPERIEYWATRWFEPPRKLVDIGPVDESKVGHLVARLDANWRRFYETGEVRDRSAAFVALAHWCAERGWSPKDTYLLLWCCPWNKYATRTDGDMYVRDIVERAYS